MESGYLVKKEKINKIESIVSFGNLKSSYILKFLFKNLEKKK